MSARTEGVAAINAKVAISARAGPWFDLVGFMAAGSGTEHSFILGRQAVSRHFAPKKFREVFADGHHTPGVIFAVRINREAHEPRGIENQKPFAHLECFMVGTRYGEKPS